MKRFLKWVGIILAGIIMLITCSLFIFYLRWRGLEPGPFYGSDGAPIRGGVSSLEWFALGGVPHAVTIRARSTENPILLVLYGGPGSPEGMLVRHFRSHA